MLEKDYNLRNIININGLILIETMIILICYFKKVRKIL